MTPQEDTGHKDSDTRAKKTAASNDEAGRPFRLVKYFSFTGFTVILVFTLLLTLFISHQARSLVLKKSEDYALLLANNLNHQVFLQFVLPSAIRFGRVRLRDNFQFNLLDAVVRSTIQGFNVEQVNIYDLEGNITYSTDKNLVGETYPHQDTYNQALAGKNAAVLTTTPGKGFFWQNRSWTLKTFIPFRAEKPVAGAVGDVLGVFEIHQDLTRDYTEITRFQFISVGISLLFLVVLFYILRRILVRGEKIIEARNEERRRLEEKLFHSQRLANLGQMVAAVAHEIRNPLGIISSTSEILQVKIKKYEPGNRLPEVIVEESRRLNGIVTEFLDFARPQVPKQAPCRLEGVLDKIITYLEPSLEKDGIRLERDYQGPDTIEADADLLYRAFLNIFNNAVQAMSEGGTLSVSTSQPYGGDGKNLGIVEVVIADTGAGIDPAQAEELFNPFFTTKNRGSGLGLAIVKNIVEAHKGTVAIQPRESKGTRLVVRLPIRP